MELGGGAANRRKGGGLVPGLGRSELGCFVCSELLAVEGDQSQVDDIWGNVIKGSLPPAPIFMKYHEILCFPAD